MQNEKNIVKYTTEELSEMLSRGESKTDWSRVSAISQDEVERMAEEEDGSLAEDWQKTVILGLPPRKKEVHIRLDEDLLDWFKQGGKGYQTRINSVLRAFVQAKQRIDNTVNQTIRKKNGQT